MPAQRVEGSANLPLVVIPADIVVGEVSKLYGPRSVG